MRHPLLTTRHRCINLYLKWYCRNPDHARVCILSHQPQRSHSYFAANASIFRQKDARHTTSSDAVAFPSRIGWQQLRCLSAGDQSEPQQPSPTDGSKQPTVQDSKVAAAAKKPSLAVRIWHEIVHYWNGFRLLLLEMRIASRIGFKYLRGISITRRERRHFVRTVADMFRMVPFIFFIVVPLAELLLPFYLKFMPFMLPSTFQEKDKEAEKLRLRLKAKLETAKFLQATLQEGIQLKSASGEARQSLEDFRKFVTKCSTAGRYASTEELLRFSRLFADELTLDSLERPQLAAICKLLEVPAVGSQALIVLQLEIRLRRLHADDQVIQTEGLDKLNVAELQAACRARGMRSLGMSEERLKQQLTQWLDLHLNSKVPTSLLLLSRSLHFPDNLEPEELLRKTIAALPQQAVVSVEASASGDNRVKLEALKTADKAVAKEAREAKEARAMAQEVAGAAAAEVGAGPAKAAAAAADAAAAEGVGSQDLRQLESAISQLAGERLLQDQELRDLKQSQSQQIADGAGQQPSKAATLLSGKLATLVGEIDGMMDKVQQERADIERRLKEDIGGDVATTGQLQEQLVSLNDLVQALKRFQRNPDDRRWEKILPLLDEDNDGKIEIHHVTQVIELLGSDSSRLSSSDLSKLLEALDKERQIHIHTKDCGGSAGKDCKEVGGAADASKPSN